MVDTRKYVVDRIVDRKVVLLDDADETVQVIVNKEDFAPVQEGDVLLVSWTGPVGSTSYTILLQQETQERRRRIQDKINRLKNKKPRK